MNNKIAIVTGADGDMGMEETRAVAKAGYHTIMACYCPAKAEEKCQKLIEETGNKNIEVIGIDLANLQTVRHFADTIKERFGRVDLLMNNAGTTFPHIIPTKEMIDACGEQNINKTPY